MMSTYRQSVGRGTGTARRRSPYLNRNKAAAR